jgi:hypothetical protein
MRTAMLLLLLADPQPAAANDACALVTTADVQQAVGAPVGDPERRPAASSADVTFTNCSWPSPDGFKSLGVGLRLSKKGDGDPAYARQTMAGSGMTVEDVAGLGDVAFWTVGMNQLQVFRGKHTQLTVTVLGFGQPKDVAIAVARKALEKL